MKMILPFILMISTLPCWSQGLAPGKQVLGAWKIRRALRTSNISALTNKEIRSYIGRKITYCTREFVSDGLSVPTPVYRSSSMTNSEFFATAYIPLSEINVKGDQVTVLKVADKKGTQLEQLGAEVYLGGPRPIIVIDGVFFELQMIGECHPVHRQ